MTKYCAQRLFDGGDPYVLKYNGVYYAYCTTENDLPAFTKEYPFFETCKNGVDGIEVHISTDLLHWKNGGYCLKKENVLGEHGFWAPEVSHYNGKFYMVYAADSHLAVAVSDRPTGPFRKWTDDWLLSQPAIDGHFLFDDDGCIYLYYSDVGNGRGNEIYVAKMSPDLKRTETTYPACLIRAEKPWETIDCHVAEGPFVIKHKGWYYLSYSANHTRCEDYAVGYAVSDRPIGPFQKSSDNPILHKFREFVGTGHHSFMPTEDENKYICIYHCHNGRSGHFKPRQVCLAEAEFVRSEAGYDKLVIHQ